ncbi:MAG TPA: methyltransferase [Candidatus Dormibacteraeota bacterium]
MLGSDVSHSLVSRFGDALRRAGYREAELRQVVGTSSSLGHDARATEVARRRLALGNPLHTLIKAFCLGIPLTRNELTQAVGAATVDDLVRLAIVTGKQDTLTPLIAIDAAQDLLIAHDPARRGVPLRGDHVIGLGPAPRTLAALTVRSKAGRVLDLGTGSGIHALLALNHSDEVVATDINPRALAYTRFNAALNRVAMPTTRQGNLFEPLAEEAFDLIVANPPYVLSPDLSVRFRDGGMIGDELSRTVVREAARHLTDGGFASILVSWAHGEEEAWQAPLAGWVRGIGCDALLLRFRTYDPVTYASLWIKEEAEFAETLDRWLAYYDGLGIRAMSSGAVILRRRSGVNWMRSAHMLSAPIQDASQHLLHIFDASDRLSHMTDTELLEQRFRPHPSHRIHRTGVSRGGSYVVEGQYLEAIGGIPIRVSLGEFGSRLLGRLDGNRSLRTVASQLNPTRGMTAGDVARSAVQLATQLGAFGFLEIDEAEFDHRGFIDIGVDRRERSLVTS